MKTKLPIAKRMALSFTAREWDVIASALCVQYYCRDWQECTAGEVATLLRRAMLVVARAVIAEGSRPAPMAVDLREAGPGEWVSGEGQIPTAPMQKKKNLPAKIPSEWFFANFIQPILRN